MLISRFLTVGESIVAMFYKIGIKPENLLNRIPRTVSI